MMKIARKLKDLEKTLHGSAEIRKEADQHAEREDLLNNNAKLERPADQMQLDEKELDEEFTRILNANNPRAPQNTARFLNKERAYKVTPNMDHLISHFAMDGHLIFKEETEDSGVTAASASTTQAANTAEAAAEGVDNGEEAKEGEETATHAHASSSTKHGGENSKNQFNTSERAAQSFNYPSREVAVSTEPPPQSTYSGSVTQWSIYDAYREDINAKERLAKDKAKTSQTAGKSHQHSSNAQDALLLPANAHLTKAAPVTGPIDPSAPQTPLQTTPTLAQSFRVLERMANLNTYDDIAMDYQYWEDTGDDFRDGKGVLLPLWRFSGLANAGASKMTTGLCWSHQYVDLFAVGYGSYDFVRQGIAGAPSGFSQLHVAGAGGAGGAGGANSNASHANGASGSGGAAGGNSGAGAGAGGSGNVQNGQANKLDDKALSGGGQVLCCSLKNPSHPEIVYQTPCGVMCLDFSKEHKTLLAVGLYDGSVRVYDLALKTLSKPIFDSAYDLQKHTEPVWQVIWQPDDIDGNPNFISISSDGRVTTCTLVKNTILHNAHPDHQDIISLRIDTPALVTPAEQIGSLLNPTIAQTMAVVPPRSLSPVKGGPAAVPFSDANDEMFLAGTCCDFNKDMNTIFVVGTDEGRIMKCSLTYHSNYLVNFDGHDMGVYAIRYNPFFSRVFLSASADWTVKLWHEDHPSCLLTFDLGSSVGDVVWSPYSSTTFAAVSAEGKVFVFDLSASKTEALCEQQLVTKSRLTHLAFNPSYHGLTASDDAAGQAALAQQSPPILLVSDDRGAVTCVKVSPNLRKVRRQGDDEEQSSRVEKIVRHLIGESDEPALLR